MTSEQDIRSRVAEYAPDLEDARRLIALNESQHNGDIREQRGEEWYLSAQARNEHNATWIEMGVTLPRVVLYLDSLLAEVERLQTALAAVSSKRDAAQFWKSEHLRIYDYNRFGTIAFSGLPEQLPEPDVLRSLANERKRFTLVMYLEDYQTPSDVEATARQHDDAAARNAMSVKLIREACEHRLRNEYGVLTLGEQGICEEVLDYIENVAEFIADAEQAARQHDDAAERSPETGGG